MHASSFRSPPRSRLCACLVAALSCAAALADDCDAVRNAVKATQRAPALRQFLSVTGRPERLTSVTKGDTVYLTLGPGRWQKTPRAEVDADAAEAASSKHLSQCRATGRETLDGTPTTVYTYDWSVDGGPTRAAKAWVAADGLLRRQSTERGFVRYDYANVQAPD